MSRMGFTEDWLPPPSASANYFLLNSDHTDSAKTLANKWKWSTSSLNHIYCKFIFSISICSIHSYHMSLELQTHIYDKLSDVAKAWVQRRSDFQSGFRVLKEVLWTFSYLISALWTFSYLICGIQCDFHTSYLSFFFYTVKIFGE